MGEAGGESRERGEPFVLAALGVALFFLRRIVQKNEGSLKPFSELVDGESVDTKSAWTVARQRSGFHSLERFAGLQALEQRFADRFVAEERGHFFIEALERLEIEKLPRARVGEPEAPVVVEDENALRHALEKKGKKIAFFRDLLQKIQQDLLLDFILFSQDAADESGSHDRCGSDAPPALSG